MNYKKHADKIAKCCAEFDMREDFYSFTYQALKWGNDSSDLKVRFKDEYDQIGKMANKYGLDQDYIFKIIFGL